MTGTKERSFLFGTDAAACAEPGKRFGFYLWNFGILLLSAAGLCFLSLLLGIGTGGRVLLIDYLRHPLIFFLNFLPILLFELFYVLSYKPHMGRIFDDRCRVYHSLCGKLFQAHVSR